MGHWGQESGRRRWRRTQHYAEHLLTASEDREGKTLVTQWKQELSSVRTEVGLLRRHAEMYAKSILRDLTGSIDLLISEWYWLKEIDRNAGVE